jgi:hypothetical protein
VPNPRSQPISPPFGHPWPTTGNPGPPSWAHICAPPEPLPRAPKAPPFRPPPGPHGPTCYPTLLHPATICSLLGTPRHPHAPPRPPRGSATRAPPSEQHLGPPLTPLCQPNESLRRETDPEPTVWEPLIQLWAPTSLPRCPPGKPQPSPKSRPLLGPYWDTPVPIPVPPPLPPWGTALQQLL